jgi:hypothetical protein
VICIRAICQQQFFDPKRARCNFEFSPSRARLYARSPSILTAEKRGGVLHDIADKLGELGFDLSSVGRLSLAVTSPSASSVLVFDQDAR